MSKQSNPNAPLGPKPMAPPNPNRAPELGLEQLQGLVTALESLRESAIVMREYQKEIADLTWHRYRCLVMKGFKEEQALYIITHRPEIV